MTAYGGGAYGQGDYGVGSASAASYASQVLADSPLGYYRLGEASGSVMADSSGRGNNGTYPSTPSSPTLGAPGLLVGDADTAVTFTGGQRALVPYASWMSVPQFTAECVFELSTLTGDMAIINRANYDASNTSPDRVWFIHQNGGSLSFGVYFEGGGYYTSGGVATLVTGKPYHVALTYDGTTARLFLNGSLVGSVVRAGNPRAGSGVDLNVAADQGGNLGTTTGITIDEVAFYDHPLSQTRLVAHADATGNTPQPAGPAYSNEVLADGPAVYYPVQEPVAVTTVEDKSGNSRTGSYVNGAAPNQADATPPVGVGRAARLDGTDDHILFDNTSTWFTPAANGFTLEGWFYVRAWTNWMRFFDLANAANTTDISWGSNNAGGMFVGLNGTNYNYSPRPAVNTWIHVVLTCTAAGLLTIYVNGSQVYQVQATAPVDRARQYKYAGKAAYADPYLQASVSQIAVYNSVLSPTRVTAHYDAGVATSQTIALNQASTTATAQTLTPVLPAQIIALNQASTTATAQTLTPILPTQTVALNQAATTATAQALTPVLGSLAIPLGQAETTATAQTLGVLAGQVIALGQAGVTVAAQSLTVGLAEIRRTLGRATYTYAAQSLSGHAEGPQTLPMGQAEVAQGAVGLIPVITTAGAAGRVVHWRFDDPDSGDHWTFVVNPNKMSSPFAARNLTLAHGTKAGPRRIRAVDNAPSAPKSWTFSGYYYTKAHHDTLWQWATRDSMTRVTDHLGRTFEVIIESFNPVDRRPRANAMWRGQFEMTCLVLREVGRA